MIVRSVFDRTLLVLGRAAAVAAPAGLVIWGMANVSVEGKACWPCAPGRWIRWGGCWEWTASF